MLSDLLLGNDRFTKSVLTWVVFEGELFVSGLDLCG